MVSAFSPLVTASYVRVCSSTRKVTTLLREKWHHRGAKWLPLLCKHHKQRCKIHLYIEQKWENYASHLSIYLREQIIALWERKDGFRNLSDFGIQRAKNLRTTVRRWVFRWRTNHGLRNQHHCGQKSKITTEMAAFLEAKCRKSMK